MLLLLPLEPRLSRALISLALQVGDFKKQIAAALKETYEIFSKFRVDWLHYPLLDSNEVRAQQGGSSSRPLFWLGNNPPDKAKIEQFLPLSSTKPVRLSPCYS
jgi:hypothetical protein